MTPAIKDRVACLGPLGRCLFMALWLGVSCALAIPLIVCWGGMAALGAALAAASVVYLASVGGILLGELFRNPTQAIGSVLLGMMARFSISFAACIVAALQGGPLVRAGFIYFVLGFYLIVLPADTLLAVLKIESSHGA